MASTSGQSTSGDRSSNNQLDPAMDLSDDAVGDLQNVETNLSEMMGRNDWQFGFVDDENFVYAEDDGEFSRKLTFTDESVENVKKYLNNIKKWTNRMPQEAMDQIAVQLTTAQENLNKIVEMLTQMTQEALDKIAVPLTNAQEDLKIIMETLENQEHWRENKISSMFAEAAQPAELGSSDEAFGAAFKSSFARDESTSHGKEREANADDEIMEPPTKKPSFDLAPSLKENRSQFGFDESNLQEAQSQGLSQMNNQQQGPMVAGTSKNPFGARGVRKMRVDGIEYIIVAELLMPSATAATKKPQWSIFSYDDAKKLMRLISRSDRLLPGDFSQPASTQHTQVGTRGSPSTIVSGSSPGITYVLARETETRVLDTKQREFPQRYSNKEVSTKSFYLYKEACSFIFGAAIEWNRNTFQNWKAVSLNEWGGEDFGKLWSGIDKQHARWTGKNLVIPAENFDRFCCGANKWLPVVRERTTKNVHLKRLDEVKLSFGDKSLKSVWEENMKKSQGLLPNYIHEIEVEVNEMMPAVLVPFWEMRKKPNTK